MKYFKMLDNPKNASKIDLSTPSKSVLELKTQISGKKRLSEIVLVLLKIVKCFKMFDYLKNT